MSNVIDIFTKKRFKPGDNHVDARPSPVWTCACKSELFYLDKNLDANCSRCGVILNPEDAA